MNDRPHHIEIPLKGIHDKESLHALLADRLSFPDYYGRNWDAFWDVIGDSMPERLTFADWDDFKAAMPNEAQILQEMLGELAATFPEIGGEVEYKPTQSATP